MDLLKPGGDGAPVEITGGGAAEDEHQTAEEVGPGEQSASHSPAIERGKAESIKRSAFVDIDAGGKV